MAQAAFSIELSRLINERKSAFQVALTMTGLTRTDALWTANNRFALGLRIALASLNEITYGGGTGTTGTGSTGTGTTGTGTTGTGTTGTGTTGTGTTGTGTTGTGTTGTGTTGTGTTGTGTTGTGSTGTGTVGSGNTLHLNLILAQETFANELVRLVAERKSSFFIAQSLAGSLRVDALRAATSRFSQ